jgi:hypothetical protein
MGKILGKPRKLPQAAVRNTENPCATGVPDDSEGQKIIGKTFPGNGKADKRNGKIPNIFDSLFGGCSVSELPGLGAL